MAHFQPDFETLNTMPGIFWMRAKAGFYAAKIDVDEVCATTGKSYMGLLHEAQVDFTSQTSEFKQELLTIDQMMTDLLTSLQDAADETKNTAASKLTLMVWRAQYVQALLLVAEVRCTGANYDAASVVQTDTSLEVRIETLLRDARNDFITVLTELDSLLPGMRFEEIYAMEGPEPDIARVGTLVSAEETAHYKSKVLQAPTPTADWQRDPHIRCSFCLDEYTTLDPPFRLACGHVVGQTCMTTWLHSSNAQATSCPQCKHILCPLRKRVMISPTAGQVARAQYLREHLGTLGTLASHTVAVVRKVHGRGKARQVAEDVTTTVDEELRKNGVQFRMLIGYTGPSGRLIFGSTRR